MVAKYPYQFSFPIKLLNDAFARFFLLLDNRSDYSFWGVLDFGGFPLESKNVVTGQVTSENPQCLPS